MVDNKINMNKPPIELNPEIKQIYMTGALGGYTPHDFRLFIFNEKPKMEEPDLLELVRSVDYELIMSYPAVKELYDWLGKRVKEFEEEMENDLQK